MEAEATEKATHEQAEEEREASSVKAEASGTSGASTPRSTDGSAEGGDRCDFGLPNPTKASSKRVHIPLVGLGEYGVWKAQVNAGAVRELREYLCRAWTETGGKLPLGKGQRPLFSYGSFQLTSAAYDSVQQTQNTLRWSFRGTRPDSIRDHLPGFAPIEDDVRQIILQRFPLLARALGLHNGHVLRQFYEADGGSGFRGHVRFSLGSWTFFPRIQYPSVS